RLRRESTGLLVMRRMCLAFAVPAASASTPAAAPSRLAVAFARLRGFFFGLFGGFFLAFHGVVGLRLVFDRRQQFRLRLRLLRELPRRVRRMHLLAAIDHVGLLREIGR